MKLYVILCQNNKRLIHVTFTPRQINVLTECKIIYDFAIVNAPVHVEEEYEIEDILEVDMFIKTYMREYGIDNVRGGSYIDIVLPDHLYETLKTELSLSVEHYTNNEEMIDGLKDNYDEKLRVDRERVKQELREYRLKHDNYATLQNKLNIIRYIETTRSQSSNQENVQNTRSVLDNESKGTDCNINQSIFDDIQWLKTWILNWKTTVYKHKNNDNDTIQMPYEKYDFITRKLAIMVELYTEIKELEDEPTRIDASYKTPNTVFDVFMYTSIDVIKRINEDEIDAYIQNIIVFINTLKYFAYYVVNRKTEYEFDIKYYTENEYQYIGKSGFVIDYLESILV